MQINYKYWHKKTGINLKTLLIPEYNVCYGSLILRDFIEKNKKENKAGDLNGWKSIGDYNTSNYRKQIEYIKKVVRNYLKEE